MEQVVEKQNDLIITRKCYQNFIPRHVTTPLSSVPFHKNIAFIERFFCNEFSMHLAIHFTGIEAIIGYLKSDFRLRRNFLKGSVGDSINLMLAAAFNFKKWMRQLEELFKLIFIAMILRSNYHKPANRA